MTYCGVGAHHQNGVSERAIRSIVSWTRAVMMNQMLHWPAGFDEANWSLAMEHACWIWNNLPRQDSRLTPEELFTGLKLPNHDSLNNLRVWGCPVWVLHPRLQTASKIPRWKPRSRLGVYVGQSDSHHGSVGRILNLRSGHISPQWHCAQDEKFQSVFCDVESSDGGFDPDFWRNLLQLGAIDQKLDPCDRNDKAVVKAAEGYFHEFVDDMHDESDDDLPDLDYRDDYRDDHEDDLSADPDARESEGDDNDEFLDTLTSVLPDSPASEGDDPLQARHKTMRGREVKPVK